MIENISEEIVSFSNQERARKVEAREKPTKLFHVTPRRYRIGETVEISENGVGVYLSDRPLPHYTIASERVMPEDWWVDSSKERGVWNKKFEKANWHAYEVEPLGEIRYGVENNEIIAKGAKIIRYVGNAKSLLEKHKRRVEGRELGSNKKIGSEVHGIGKIKMGKDKVRLSSGKIKEYKRAEIKGRTDDERYWEWSEKMHKKKKDGNKLE